MRAIGKLAFSLAGAFIFSVSLQAMPAEDESAMDCESTLTADLRRCASERLATAEAVLRLVIQSRREQLGPQATVAFTAAHQKWLESRDAECEAVLRQVWPGREAAIEQLLCQEQQTLARVQQLTNVDRAGVARCNHSEATVRFSCGSAGGDLIRICEAPDRRARESGSIRLEIESMDAGVASVSLGPPDSPLRYNHYMRFRTDYLEIAARTSDTEYRVFRHYEDSLVSYGVVIRKHDESEIRIDCAGDAFDQLSGLPEILECDMESAIGCGVPDPSVPRSD